MTRRNPHGELKGFSKKDAKYIEQSDTKCPSCNSSSSIISDSNMKGFVKTCDSSRCGWHQILHGAESFDAEDEVNAWDGGDVLEIKVVSPKSGESVWTPEENEYCGFSIGYDGRKRGCLVTGDGLRYPLVVKSLICDKNKDTIRGRTQGSGFAVSVKFGNKKKFNDACNMIENIFNAESFEARDDDFKEIKWTFDDLEESEGAGPSVLRPERTYSREDAEIEDMIDRVMERLYYFRKMYYTAKKERNRKAMYIAIRNFKALEGVNQALRWTLGEKGVGHPLY